FRPEDRRRHAGGGACPSAGPPGLSRRGRGRGPGDGGVTAPETLPRLLARNAERHGGEVALREKRYGIWRSVTWAQYHARTRLFALGLRRLGVRPGEVIGLVGDNRPDWVMGELAAHAIGGRSLGLYRDSLEDEMAWLLEHAGASVVF